jgi:hypothetical protein
MQIGHFSHRTEENLLLTNEPDEDEALGVAADVAEGESAGAAKANCMPTPTEVLADAWPPNADDDAEAPCAGVSALDNEDEALGIAADVAEGESAGAGLIRVPESTDILDDSLPDEDDEDEEDDRAAAKHSASCASNERSFGKLTLLNQQ